MALREIVLFPDPVLRRVARPVRNLWKIRTVVRRRHRTWMVSMSFATLGWGSWWITAVLMKLAPSIAPDVRVTCWVASTFALVGFLAALWSIRARLAWLLFTLVPLFANGSLLLVPLVLPQGHTLAMAAATVLIVSERFDQPRLPRWEVRGAGKLLRAAIARTRIRLNSPRFRLV